MGAVAFNWSRYLDLAKDLGSRHDEASLRSAISRAYYHVYHLALQRALNNGFQPARGESTHHQLWRVFSDSPEPDCQRLAFIANKLKEKRQRADYEGRYSRAAEDVPDVNHRLSRAC